MTPDELHAVNTDRGGAVCVPCTPSNGPYHPDSIPGLMAAAQARMAEERL